MRISYSRNVQQGYCNKLQYPVNIKTPNAKLAKVIISQLGGPDGELAASLRYLNQRYSMPYAEVKGLLTDIGTEELAHVEMISAILYQLTKGLSMEEIKASGFDTYFVDHTTGIYPVAASGAPFTAAYFQSKGDIITDLHENMAADAALCYTQPVQSEPDAQILFVISHFPIFGHLFLKFGVWKSDNYIIIVKRVNISYIPCQSAYHF